MTPWKADEWFGIFKAGMDKGGQVRGGKFDTFLLGVFLEMHFQCAIKSAEFCTERDFER